jgi:hypothetical protein
MTQLTNNEAELARLLVLNLWGGPPKWAGDRPDLRANLLADPDRRWMKPLDGGECAFLHALATEAVHNPDWARELPTLTGFSVTEAQYLLEKMS